MENNSACDSYQETRKDMRREPSEENDFNSRSQDTKDVTNDSSLLKRDVSKGISNTEYPFEFFSSEYRHRVFENKKIYDETFEQNMGGDTEMNVPGTNSSNNIKKESELELKHGNDLISDLFLEVNDIFGESCGEGKTSETISKGRYSHILGCKDVIQEKFILQNINEGNQKCINNTLIEKGENNNIKNLKRNLLMNILKVDDRRSKSIEDGVGENLSIQRRNDSRVDFERMPNFRCIDLLRKGDRIVKKSEYSTLGGRNNLTRAKNMIKRVLLKGKSPKKKDSYEKVEFLTTRNMDSCHNEKKQHKLLSEGNDDSMPVSYSEAVLVNDTKDSFLEPIMELSQEKKERLGVGIGNFNDHVVRTVLLKIKSKAIKRIDNKEKVPSKWNIIKPPWIIIFPPHKYRHYYPSRTIWWLSLALVECVINLRQSS